MRREELDDRRIQKHIDRALKVMEDNVDERHQKVMDHLDHLQEPLHAKFIDLSKEC